MHFISLNHSRIDCGIDIICCTDKLVFPAAEWNLQHWSEILSVQPETSRTLSADDGTGSAVKLGCGVEKWRKSKHAKTSATWNCFKMFLLTRLNRLTDSDDEQVSAHYLSAWMRPYWVKSKSNRVSLSNSDDIDVRVISSNISGGSETQPQNPVHQSTFSWRMEMKNINLLVLRCKNIQKKLCFRNADDSAV